jgi:hypothetical protein
VRHPKQLVKPTSSAQEPAVKQTPKPTPPTSETASRLSGIRGLPHDEDERPSREDADYGQTILTREPVPLPRWLTGRKRRKGS